MKILNFLSAILIVLGIFVFVSLANCRRSGSDRNDGERDENANDVTPVGCDPDGVELCPDDWFVCDEDEQGDKHCEGQNPAVPDDGVWDCTVVDDELVCVGDEMPEGDEWDCVTLYDGSVECHRDVYFPASGGDEVWDCEYEGEFVVCDEDGYDDSFPDDGTDECPPEVEFPQSEVCGDGLDNDCDGSVDEDCAIDDCLCIPGAMRYCDTPTYCAWGVQYCDEDGMRWGACIETTAPTGCDDQYYYDDVCCVSIGACCQDFWDSDDDGDIDESIGDCVGIVCI